MKIFTAFICVMLLAPYTLAVDAGFLLGAGQSELKTDEAVALLTEDKGFRIGVPLKFGINDFLDLRSGFFYATRTYQFSHFWTDPVSGQFGTDSIEIRLGYLDFPMLIQLNLSNWFALNLGPVYSVNVSEHVNSDFVSNGVVEGEKTGMISWQAGVSFTFGNIGVDLVYEAGLSDVYTEVDAKWKYIGLNLIYWFNTTEDIGYDSPSKYRIR